MTAPIAAALLLVAVGGYLLHWSWTGYLSDEQAYKGPRQLWDWLTLALQPMALAFIPVVLKYRHSRREAWQVAALVVGLVFAVLVLGGYSMGWTWTGFSGNTLWNWLQLFLMPFLLPMVFIYLAEWERANNLRSEVAAPVPTSSPAAGTTHRYPAPRRLPPGPSTATLGAAGALAAAAFIVGWLAHTPAHTPSDSIGRGSTQPVVAPGYPVTVDSAAASWTETGVRVRKGERVEISGFGLVRSSSRPGYPAAGPDGESIVHPSRDSVVPAFHHEALLATIAPAGQTMSLTEHRAPESVVDVGQHRAFDVRRGGELYLGVNDTGPANNSGWFGAEITVAK